MSFSEATKAMRNTFEFIEGWDAWCVDKGWDANPYSPPSQSWERWRYGWMAAEEGTGGSIVKMAADAGRA